MSRQPPTLINLPPPPSDPATPNEAGPGTPNSTTTSLSALSVVAIKDGATGHGGRGISQSANTLEAERADRISRLAGLERVATSRTTSSGHLIPGVGPPNQHYDQVPQYKERSTVGSASATGSVGGRTTWASESMDLDGDKMSEDQDDGTSSTGGFSDEDKASLVGFGEGANSTVSGPVSTANARLLAARNFNNQGIPPRTGPMVSGQSTPMSGIMPSAPGAPDPKMMDGITYDQGVVDTTVSTPPLAENQARLSSSGDMSENMMRESIGDVENGRRGLAPQPDQQAGTKYGFENDF